MKDMVAVSILTNSTRLQYLQSCVFSFLSTCYYRPLTIAIFDNGSTDDTVKWLADLPKVYAVQWKTERSDKDLGCAVGTNSVSAMVRDFEYVLHLESDFLALPEEVTGEDKMWLHRTLDFMKKEGCDYLYLRKMMNKQETDVHYWAQWQSKIDKRVGNYLRCPSFWWSNNPHLRRNESVYETKTLPLNETLDGAKGTEKWSMPEFRAPRPKNTWLHKTGLFVHGGG